MKTRLRRNNKRVVAVMKGEDTQPIDKKFTEFEETLPIDKKLIEFEETQPIDKKFNESDQTPTEEEYDELDDEEYETPVKQEFRLEIQVKQEIEVQKSIGKMMYKTIPMNMFLKLLH